MLDARRGWRIYIYRRPQALRRLLFSAVIVRHISNVVVCAEKGIPQHLLQRCFLFKCIGFKTSPFYPLLLPSLLNPCPLVFFLRLSCPLLLSSSLSSSSSVFVLVLVFVLVSVRLVQEMQVVAAVFVSVAVARDPCVVKSAALLSGLCVTHAMQSRVQESWH